MSDKVWERNLILLDAIEREFVAMTPAEPMPRAQFCRESAHRTLGHLTSCQAAWLPIMAAIRDGSEHVVLAIHPNGLYRDRGFARASWPRLLDQFVCERREWREILETTDRERNARTQTRAYTTTSLTRRLVEHERRHLNDLPGVGGRLWGKVTV